MNITPQEQEDVKKVLWHNIKYRETFDEVYDHVLTGIEQETASCNAGAIARTIINNEFGGWDGIEETEKVRAQQISKHLKAKLWVYFKEWFSFPLIVLTLVAAASVYYAADIIPRKAMFLVVFCFTMMPVPFWVKAAPCNRFSKKYKPSIKAGIAERMGTIGMSILNCLIFIPGIIFNNDDYKFFRDVHASFITVIAVLFLVYGFSAIKVFKEDLKISVV